MATQVTLNSGAVSSAGSLKLQTNGTTDAVTIDTSQNLGLGVTPSAWYSSYKALQVKTSSLAAWGNNEVYLMSNAYGDSSSTYKYLATGSKATSYVQYEGTHLWNTAGTGTAGNAITFTQAMTLDASGNLGVGATSPASRLHVYTASGTADVRIQSNTYASSFSLYAGAGGANAFGIYDNNASAYRAIIDSSGNVGIGTSSPFGDLHVQRADAAELVLQATNSGGHQWFIQTGDTASGLSGSLRFYDGTALAERMRIDSSGNLLVGTTSTVGASTPGASFSPSTGGRTILALGSNNTGAGYELIQFYNPNGKVGRIETSGSSTAYVTSSDYRLKENPQPMQNALATVSQLKPCTYTWKADGSEGQGFIAHELQAVVPDAVFGDKDAVDVDGNPVYQGIDTSFLVATLTAAIQEQQSIIQQLTARIEALEAK